MSKVKRAVALIGLTAAFALPAGVAVAVDACPYPAASCTPATTSTTTTTTVPGGGGTGGSGQASASTQAAATGSLPVTGGDIVGLTLLGAGAFAAGTVLVRRSRRA